MRDVFELIKTYGDWMGYEDEVFELENQMDDIEDSWGEGTGAEEEFEQLVREELAAIFDEGEVIDFKKRKMLDLQKKMMDEQKQKSPITKHSP